MVNALPDAVTSVAVGSDSGVVADVVHDTPEGMENERCVESYLEHPIETFYMNGDGDPVIPLCSMPAQASFHLKGLDRTNSGSVPVSELRKAVEALQREKAHNRMLYKIIAFFFLFSALVAISMGGVTWFIFQRTKDLKVEHQILKSIQDNQAVKTASTEFKVVENRLVPRICEEEFCPAVQVSVGVVERPLSSTISNSDLKALEAVSVEGEGGALVFVKLHAFSRFADAASKHGTLLVLFTELGEITMDGEEITLSAQASDAFERSGFLLGDSRRSIEHSGVQTFGYFQMQGAQTGADTRSDEMDLDLWASMRRRMRDLRQLPSASASAFR